MDYLLLTGCTGLVGRYLLRDLLQAGARVAVLARNGRSEPALDRVEAVMDYWEQLAGRALPRPVVLAAELCEPDLGLSASDEAWIARRCRSIVHCAASMTFREDRRGEPFRTNVGGTQHVLDLCRRTGLRDFHHVSTAYICGLRSGRILETQADEGQTLGNVYEESKLKAELLIRQAAHLDRVTVYRPASVVGDSRSGYVTNYHGFYLPLQLAYSMSGTLPVVQMTERFSQRLGLTGAEGKNLVPVDWLAAAISHLVLRREHHGKTYHLAAAQPVLVSDIQQAIQQALVSGSDKPQAAPLSEQQLQSYESLFHDYMLIYRSHWRDDPQFDLTNTRQALPHLPSPVIDRDMLLRIALYPVKHKFQARRHHGVSVAFDVHRYLAHLLNTEPAEEVRSSGAALTSVGLQVNGSGGGQWSLLLGDGRVAGAEPGLPRSSQDRIYLSSETLAALTRGKLTVQQSVQQGRVLLEARGRPPAALAPILEQLVLRA